MTRQTMARSAVGLAAVLAVAGGYAYLQKDVMTRAVAAPLAASATAQTSAAPMAVAVPMDFSAIVERYGPAVVNISTTARAAHLHPGFAARREPGRSVRRVLPALHAPGAAAAGRPGRQGPGLRLHRVA